VVLLVLSGEVSVSPYLAPYLKILDEKGVVYKVVAWCPRDDSGLYYNPEGTIEFVVKKRSSNKINKILNYFKYRLFVIKQINKYNPEKIVFLTTPSVFFIPKRILKKYKNKYIFDYRDATYEYHDWYLKKVRLIASYSTFTSISSYGFQKLFEGIPQIVNCHNVYDYTIMDCEQNNKDKTQFNILYFGIVRDLSGILGLFDNDDRFNLCIYGKMDKETKTLFDNYLRDNGIKNIQFKGSYIKSQINEIANDFDAVLYYYKKTFNFSLALGNRYYDSLKFIKPMIVNPNIFCGDLVLKNKVGIGFDKDDILASRNRVYTYLKELNNEDLKQRCKDVLLSVKRENEYWIEKIESFLYEKK